MCWLTNPATTRLVAAGLPEYFADYLRLGGNLPMPSE